MPSRAFVTVTHVQAHARTHAKTCTSTRTETPADALGQFGAQFLAQGHISIWTGGTGDQASVQLVDNLLYLLRPNHQLQYHYGC